VERNDSLYANAVRHTSNHESVTGKRALRESVLAGNHVALVSLNTLSFAFNNAKVHDNGVTGLEILDVVKRFSLDQ
jgi:hypothetical protein